MAHWMSFVRSQERCFAWPTAPSPQPRRRAPTSTVVLTTHQAHLATAGCGKPGFRRPRDDVSQDSDVDSRPPASHRGRLRFVSVARMSLVRHRVERYPRNCGIALVGVPRSTGNGTTERDHHLASRAVREVSAMARRVQMQTAISGSSIVGRVWKHRRRPQSNSICTLRQSPHDGRHSTPNSFGSMTTRR